MGHAAARPGRQAGQRSKFCPGRDVNGPERIICITHLLWPPGDALSTLGRCMEGVPVLRPGRKILDAAHPRLVMGLAHIHSGRSGGRDVLFHVLLFSFLCGFFSTFCFLIFFEIFRISRNFKIRTNFKSKQISKLKQFSNWNKIQFKTNFKLK
jgi:hypothetical protein